MKVNQKLFNNALLLVAVVGVMFLDGILEWLVGGGGFILASAPVVGTVLTQNEGESPEMNSNDFSDNLCKIYPDKFPLDTMLRSIKTTKCQSFEYEYFSVTGRKFTTTISTAFTTDSDEDLQVIKVEDVRIFSKDSNIAFPEYAVSNSVATKVTSGVSFNCMVCHIVDLDLSAKTITVQPVNVTAIPSMAVGILIARIGTAKNENAAMSEDPVSLPTKASNYCQIHMVTVSEGLYQNMSKKDVDFNINEYQEQGLYDFRSQNEAAAFFGAKSKFIDNSTGELKYMSEGICRQITKFLDGADNGVISQELLSSWMTEIFTGNNGSDSRVLFCGSKFLEALENSTTIQKQLGAMDTKVVLGVTCQIAKSSHGELAIKHAPLFSELGFENYAVCIDPANIYRAQFKPLEEQELELDKTGKARANAIRIDEAHCVVLQNLDTHAILTID